MVFGIKERGGRVRTVHVPDAKGTTLRPIILSNTRPGTTLMTDISHAYTQMRKHMRHETVNHHIEYVKLGTDIHTQGIEGYWSILKRGINGTFHHVGVGYLGQYLHEFDFRFNSRKVTDAERFASLMGQTQGRLEWFCHTDQPENPFA